MRKHSIVFAAVAALLAGVLFRQLPKSTPGPDLPRFPSYFMQPTELDAAFAAVGSVSAFPEASMVLVNHHLLAAPFIARIMAGIATPDPVTIVLVSPDHFTNGIAPATSVIADWPTPYGDMPADAGAITALASAGAVDLRAAPFVHEHGITNVTMFIRRELPQARLVPVIIRADASSKSMETLAQAITRLPGRVLIVGSFDFTHEATDAVAQANDARSLRILEEGDPDAGSGIAVDSVPGIRLMMRLAQLRGLRFIVVDRSDSARLFGDLTRTDVTSYITGYWSP